MDENEAVPWSGWTSGAYGLYGPFLSPLEAYRAEREAASLDRIAQRLDDARQTDDDQRQAIRASLARARQAQAAETDELREKVRGPTADTANAADGVDTIRDRLRQARRHREAPLVTGASERLDEPDDLGLWTVEELVPAEEAELVNEPPAGRGAEGESDGD
ncbi:hypothetical protein ACQPW3_34865 [Actinosynnema sp. CA-248983]